MRLLHSSSTRSGLAGSLGGELLAGSFSSSRLACGLFGTGHLGVIIFCRWFVRAMGVHVLVIGWRMDEEQSASFI